MKPLALAAVLAALAAPAYAAEGCPAQAAAPVKKKGPGLGALVGAARKAGLGEALLGDSALLGDGKEAQVAGAVLGAAVRGEGASPASGVAALSDLTGMYGYGGDRDAARAAQVAGVATGMVRELARGAAAAKAEPAPCASPAGPE